jgi:hypothetical protein
VDEEHHMMKSSQSVMLTHAFSSHNLRFEREGKEIKEKEQRKKERKGWSSGMAEAGSIVYL